MKEIHSNGKTLLLVEVPYNTFNHIISEAGYLWWRFRTTHNWDEDNKVYVGDNCKLIGLLRELKPEQVRPYVEQFNNPVAAFNCHGKYYDYSKGKRTHTVADSFVDTAIESFHSLLRANNIDPSLNFLLIEKVN